MVKFDSNESFFIIVIKLIYQLRLVLSFDKIVKRYL